MNEDIKTHWRPGDRSLKFSDCARLKYGRSPRWLWGYIRKHPGRLRIFYLDGAPTIIERHADEDLARWASAGKNEREKQAA